MRGACSRFPASISPRFALLSWLLKTSSLSLAPPARARAASWQQLPSIVLFENGEEVDRIPRVGHDGARPPARRAASPRRSCAAASYSSAARPSPSLALRRVFPLTLLSCVCPAAREGRQGQVDGGGYREALEARGAPSKGERRTERPAVESNRAQFFSLGDVF